MKVDKGKLTSFAANFYTGPVNGGTSNHTHQLSNFQVNNGNYVLTPDKNVYRVFWMSEQMARMHGMMYMQQW